jgi:hypothetical protein
MDPRVTEFQCIMPMANVPSVLRHGIETPLLKFVDTRRQIVTQALAPNRI